MLELVEVSREGSLVNQVQEAVKGYILKNRFQSGDNLPSEGEIARTLNINRNSVREAVKSLQTLGIVEVRHGSGLFVGRFSFEPLLEVLPFSLLTNLAALSELLEIRRTLEIALIPKAMGLMTKVEKRMLEDIMDEMQIKAEKGQTFLQEDRKFHETLLKSLGNQSLLKIQDVFWLARHHASGHTQIYNRKLKQTYLEHRSILDAVLMGDVEKTQEMLAFHYKGIEERVGKALISNTTPEEEN